MTSPIDHRTPVPASCPLLGGRTVALWIAATAALVYLALRLTTGFVWNDPVLAGVGSFAPLTAIRDAWSALISVSPGSNYRPLANLITNLGIQVVSLGTVGIQLWIGAIACTVGATASLMFAVSARVIGNRLWAGVAALLFLCSPAFLTGSWVVLAGQQPLVPLFMCLGILLYWRSRERFGWSKAFHVAGLGIVFLVGPWYREYLGVISVLVLLDELRHSRRPTVLMALGVAGVVHGLFPMLLPKLLFNSALPLIPITRLGDVGAQLKGANDNGFFNGVRLSLENLRWGVSIYFAALFPPSLVLIGFAGSSLRIARAFSQLDTARGVAQSRWYRTPGVVGVIVLITLMLLLLLLQRLIHATWGQELDAAIFISFTVFGWTISPFLGLWFVLTYIPFYKVFTEIVHLSYPMVPASIIVSAGLRDMWSAIATTRGQAAQRWFAAIILVLIGDQMLNLYGVRYVMQRASMGMQAVATALQHKIPKSSVVVGNVVHLTNIETYSSGWFKAFHAMRDGVRGPFADTRASFQALIDANPGRVYLLDADKPYTRNKYLYASHKWVRTHAVEWVDLGDLYQTAAIYPFLDPLQHLIPADYVPFLGAPDLVNDFYHGRALSGAPFFREVFVDYHLYEVTGSTVRVVDP